MIRTGQLLVFRVMECPHTAGSGRSSLLRAIIWLPMNFSRLILIAPFVKIHFHLPLSQQNSPPAYQLRHPHVGKTISHYWVVVVTIMREFMSDRTAKKMEKTII